MGHPASIIGTYTTQLYISGVFGDIRFPSLGLLVHLQRLGKRISPNTTEIYNCVV